MQVNLCMRIPEKHLLFVILIIIFCTSFIYSDEKIDLLEEELLQIKKKIENNKPYSVDKHFDVLFDLSKQYRNYSYEKSLSFAWESLSLATEISDDLKKAKAYNNIGIVYEFMNEYDSALENYNAALEFANSSNNLDETARTYVNIGIVLDYFSDYDNSEKAFIKAIQIYKESGNQTKHSDAMFHYGESLFRNNKYKKALDILKKTLSIKKNNNYKVNYSNALTYVGSIYQSWGLYDRALESYFIVLSICEEEGDEFNIATALNNIGLVYDSWKNPEKAIEYYNKALELFENIDDSSGISMALNNIGLVHSQQKDYDRAIDCFDKSLEMKDMLNDLQGKSITFLNIGLMHENKENIRLALDYFKRSLEISHYLNDLEGLALGHLYLGRIYEKLNNSTLSKKNYTKSIEIAKDNNFLCTLKDAYYGLSNILHKQKQYKDALIHYQNYSTIKDSLFNIENSVNITKTEVQYYLEKKENENEILRKSNRIQDLEITKQKSYLMFGAAILVIICFLGYFIIKEKNKSEILLHNILPSKIANQLKKNHFPKPENFENVTVFISDIVNFTNISQSLSPEEIINELNDLFTTFDDIFTKNNCERLKTVGDAYFAVCGLPDENINHVENILNSAIEILEYIKNRESEINWKMRIGIHTGSVVGGIVGTKKYVFDVLGDTMNTASRIETNSEPMMVNVSEPVYHIAKNKYKFIKRSALELKGKGWTTMYYLDV